VAEFKTTKTLFLFPCECGYGFRVSVGKAGQFVRCPNCGSDQLVSGLKELRKLKTIEKPPRPSKLQFGIRAILVITVFVAIVLGVMNRISLEATLVFVGLPVLYGLIVLSMALFFHNANLVAGWFWDLIQRK